MSLLLEVLTGGLGIFRKWPVITGLLLFSIVGMGWSYYQGQSGANEKHKAAKADAILKDAKENTRLSEAAQDIIERAKDATDKANKKSNSEIDTIKSLSPMQCLDIKLADIGLL
jgi:predicted negative regulator of RcsB-dependent stress response